VLPVEPDPEDALPDDTLPVGPLADEPVPVEPPPFEPLPATAPTAVEAVVSTVLVLRIEPPPDVALVPVDVEVVPTPGSASANEGIPAPSKMNAEMASPATSFRLLRSP